MNGPPVTVFDGSGMLGLLRDHSDAAGIASVAGDMNEGPSDGPFDAIYFGNTSRMYGPKESVALLQKMRSSLAPGGLFVVREFVRGVSEEAALFAVNMLVLTPRGNTHTASEYGAWLEGAGLVDVEVVPVSHSSSARNLG